MIRFIFLLLLVLCAFQLRAQNEWIANDKQASRESYYHKSLISFSESTGYEQTDFIYQRMEWEVDPAVRYISGIVTSYFIGKANELDTLKLDLHNNLQVDSIIYQGVKINFIHAENKLNIPFPNPLTAESIDSVSVHYHGVPPSSGFGSFETSVHGPGNTPVLWTLSEPYGAMEWWPCKQSLADKIDSIDIIVSCPVNYRTASNGIVESEYFTQNKRVMHWKHRHPIATYLIAIAVTDYATYSDTVKLAEDKYIDILNYVYPENLSKAQTQTPVTVEVMEFYNELIGEYPFSNEKYGHAQFGWGGGMEHQTMSFMGGFTFGLIAHELAHQWFGDYITLRSWQDIWLNEGFATYLNALAVENLRPDNWEGWKESFVESITSQTGGSVFVYDTTSVSRIFNYRLSYQKASYLLHMLRWIIGDEDFFSAIRAYYTDPEIANGFATTAQLQKHFETVADTSLQEFFNDWLYGEGYPVYSLNYWQSGEDELTIELMQNSSHESVDFFEMPVPVRLTGTDPSQIVDLRLNHTTNSQLFSFDPGFRVTKVEIDPEKWLVLKSDQIVSVPHNKVENRIEIYPNPSSEKLTFTLSDNSEIRHLNILSANGEKVMQFQTNIYTLDISALANGIYILEIQTDKETLREKFIKN